MTNAEKWRALGKTLAVVVPFAMVIGVTLGWLIGGSRRSMVSGATIGLIVTVGTVSFDASWSMGLIPRRWREAPFLVVVLTRSLVWLAVIFVAISLPLLTIAQIPVRDLVDQGFVRSVGLTFAAALLFNFVGQINRLLGRRVLVRLLFGRYHRPREEHRVFLLIDLRGSSQIAEQLGNLRYHTFLKRFIGDVADSVVRFSAEVHRYVGDEVILTWTADEGLRDARCLRAVFAVSETLDAAAPEYEAEFGVAPSFWAGLHIGPVVAGDVGTVKHEIVFLGDTLNTAARIEQACRVHECQFLASGELVKAVDVPRDVAAHSIGQIELRGIQDPLELFSLTRREANGHLEGASDG